MAQQVKNLPAMQKTQEIKGLIPGPGRYLEKEMATYSYFCRNNPMDGGAW